MPVAISSSTQLSKISIPDFNWAQHCFYMTFIHQSKKRAENFQNVRDNVTAIYKLLSPSNNEPHS
jgi:hypothetical protein